MISVVIDGHDEKLERLLRLFDEHFGDFGRSLVVPREPKTQTVGRIEIIPPGTFAVDHETPLCLGCDALMAWDDECEYDCGCVWDIYRCGPCESMERIQIVICARCNRAER